MENVSFIGNFVPAVVTKRVPQNFDPNLDVDTDWESNWHSGMDIYPPDYKPGSDPIESDDVSRTRINLTGDSWRTTRFICTKCGGESLGSELAGGELSEAGVWQNCPKCDEPVVLLIFNTVHKLADHPMKERAKTSSYWSLTFKRGESLTDAGLASVLAGIETLDGDNPKNDWMTLEKHSADSEFLGFAQTAAGAHGFIIEIRIGTPGSSDLGFWKAGRREPPGLIVSQSKKGRFKTFTNEVLRIEQVTAIFEHFYQQFQLHPAFAWRSILDDFLQSVPDKSAGPHC